MIYILLSVDLLSVSTSNILTSFEFCYRVLRNLGQINLCDAKSLVGSDDFVAGVVEDFYVIGVTNVLFSIYGNINYY